LGQGLSHSASHAYALAWSCMSFYLLRDVETIQVLAQTCIDLASEHGFVLFLAVATLALGWAHAESGQIELGIGELISALNIFREIGASVGLLSGLGMLAEAYGNARQYELALQTVDEGLELIEKTGGFAYASVLHRIRAELMLAANQSPQKAEGHFRIALDLARRQQARSPQLRISVGLARLLQGQGRQEEALLLLSEIYDWFTEGFETADLKEARALLQELT
jgi:tetratricopeptide (TPR) repeat protein